MYSKENVLLKRRGNLQRRWKPLIIFFFLCIVATSHKKVERSIIVSIANQRYSPLKTLLVFCNANYRILWFELPMYPQYLEINNLEDMEDNIFYHCPMYITTDLYCNFTSNIDVSVFDPLLTQILSLISIIYRHFKFYINTFLIKYFINMYLHFL